MDLAIVTPFPPRLTGIGQYGYHLARGLARSGMFDRVIVLADECGPVGSSRADGHSPEERRCWPVGDPRVGIRLLAGLRQARADAVWVNFGLSMFGPAPAALLSGLLGLTVESFTGTPMVITLHEPGVLGPAEAAGLGVHPAFGPVVRLLVGWIVRLGVVVVPLKAEADRLRREFPGCRAACIPHGTFHRPEPLPEPPDPGLLFFGFLAPYKGIPGLAAAFRQVLKKNPAATLEIAGAEHPRFPGYAESLRDALAGTPHLRWSGPVPEPEVRAVFGRNTVVVLPYRISVGASSVLYRAAAWGRPVVASDLPALRAAAAEAGLRVNWAAPGDVAGLGRVLEALLSRPDLRESQRRHNLDAVRSFTLESVTEAYGHLILRTAYGKHTSPVPQWG